MDMIYDNPDIATTILNMGAALSSLVIKGTATAVQAKVESLKKEEDINSVRQSYDEIVSQLLDERAEALRIAQVYKAELERVEISDEDIAYLQETVTKVLDIINSFSPAEGMDGKSGGEKSGVQAVEQFKSLISKDVLKTMQLLGFNFKAAIGEPLTELCAKKISGLGERDDQHNRKKR